MPSQSIYDAFLSHEGIVLFEFRGSGLFKPLAALPAWCDTLWHVKGRKAAQLLKKSPFLENFLAEAKEFWNSKTPDAVNSGNWIESDPSGRQYPLEASAFWLERKRILMIRNLSGTFVQQQQVFQAARNSLLAHERLMREIQKKEILLHCIIHDLSQPLTSMRGCFDLLFGRKLVPDVAKLVQIGQRESQRQERMIRGILDAFSGDLAPQRGVKQADAASADLISCARRAVEQFAPAFAERRIQLRLAPYLDSRRGWRVTGDAPRIDRIFGNFLENALRYSPNGSTTTVGVEDEGSALTAFVDDEGPGLPKEATSESLFSLFAKGQDRPGKAGLGLYFCKMTVERWGGSIGGENRADGGSRFWFRLPRAEVQEPSHAAGHSDASDPAIARVSPAAAATSAEKGLRILVVDDDETVRELAIEMLHGRGHFVTGAADGREALAAFERIKPDVILLDQQMPRMDGLELSRAIRQKEKRSGTARRATLVGLSGDVSAEDQRRALEAGMDALLSKPFERNTLFQVIERPRVPTPSTDQSRVAPAPPEIDLRAHLTHITAGNEKLARKLVAGFLQDFPPKLSAIERAVSHKDADKLASAAHALRGAFAIFNAHKAVGAARKLEAMGREHRLESATEEFQALSADLSRLAGELRSLFPQVSTPAERRQVSHSSARTRRTS